MRLVRKLKVLTRPTRDRLRADAMLRRLRKHQTDHARSVILVATPSHGNLGDQAIVLAQREFLAANFPDLAVFEIQRYQYEAARDQIETLIRPDDLIVIDGGGNVGTLWPEENDKMNDIVRRFSGNAVVVFPQTAYFSDDEAGKKCEEATSAAYATNERLVFFSRDKGTFEKMQAIAPRAVHRFVPDIVLYHNASTNTDRSGALLCLRDDKERVVGGDTSAALASALKARGLAVSVTSTVIVKPGRIGEWNRQAILAAKWSEFRSAKVVVTDRLHGMIFSAITGTPCVALDNVSHKVSQGNEWISHIDNIKVAGAVDEVPALLDEVLAAGPCAYDRAPLVPYHEAMRGAITNAFN